MTDSFEEVTDLQTRLSALLVEHRDLDMVIKCLSQSPPEDELLLRRLKKRKLILKDRINAIKMLTDPDELA